MNEFIEKLIGRLEEEKQACHINAEVYTERKIEKIIEVVNKLAEEYKEKSNDEWQTLYDKVCNLEKKYEESEESMGNANFCFTLKQLLRYFKEELCAEENRCR